MNSPLSLTQTREQLDALANHLSQQRDALLKRWRIATGGVSQLAFTSSLTRLQFDDHIPGVLDALAEKLRAWPGAESAEMQIQEKEQVAEHGLQRWQQGYQLRDLTREWGHLQMVLMEEMEDYAIEHGELDPRVMATARRALSHLCWNGISDSTTQYWHLHQSEAAGRVRELENALTTLNELDMARAEAWREAAHDLRGSVTVVKGAASLLKYEDLPEKTRSEFFDMLHRGVSLLHEMLNDLMSLARLEAGQEQRNVAPFDAAALLADFSTTSLPLAHERGLFLKLEGPESLLVEGDRAKILRILQNLLLNALKYTQSGGVTVLWGIAEDLDSRDWTFSVQDTGPGLNVGPTAPVARQLFEATQITHKTNESELQGIEAGHMAEAQTAHSQSPNLAPQQQPGEGVGLSIVKRLCELLDASLELETRPGEGSTFRVILPRGYRQSADEGDNKVSNER